MLIYFLRILVFEGNVMVVDRKYFERFGKFDFGLENWGVVSLGN